MHPLQICVCRVHSMCSENERAMSTEAETHDMRFVTSIFLFCFCFLFIAEITLNNRQFFPLELLSQIDRISCQHPQQCSFSFQFMTIFSLFIQAFAIVLFVCVLLSYRVWQSYHFTDSAFQRALVFEYIDDIALEIPCT